MDRTTIAAVRERAGGRCEYCRFPESAAEQTFHVEHVIARQHRGGDGVENLALACDRCNLYKGTNLSSVDPATEQITLLFHPRRDDWDDHFMLVNATIIGKTPAGRATAALLQMNSLRRRRARRALLAEGRW